MVSVTPAMTVRNGFAETARTAGVMPGDKATALQPAQQAPSAESGGDGETGFLDFLKGVIDVINPLQHLPVISTFYRKVTGDEMSPMARLAGDALFGGPIGAALAVANIATEQATGTDIGGTMLAMATGDKTAQASATSSSATAPSAARLAFAEPSRTHNLSASAQEQPQDFPTSPAPTPHRTGHSMAMDGKTPASSSYKASVMPVTPREGDTTVLAASTTAIDSGQDQNGSDAAMPSSQDAPADSGRRPASPELIAQRMADGLDKYEAMMKLRQAPQTRTLTFG